MKIMALGDPHGSQKIYQVDLSKADLVLIPGDIGKADELRKYYREYYSTGKVTLSREKVIQAYKESIDSAGKEAETFKARRWVCERMNLSLK